MIYRINSTGRENYQIKTAPSSAGRHSGHPGFLPFFIISVFFIHIHPPNPAATRPLFFIIYFPGFLYVFFVPRARDPWLYGKQMYPIYLLHIYTRICIINICILYHIYAYIRARRRRRAQNIFPLMTKELIKSNSRSPDRARS